MLWSKGSSDKEMVGKVQRRLNEWGFGPILVDYVWGDITDKAFLEFQAYNKLKVDGKLGDKTYPILFPEEVKTQKETIYENNKEISRDKTNSSLKGYTREEIQLILDYEVGGGEPYYNKFLIHPCWPEYESGVTWGCGWDARFHTKENLYDDWKKLSNNILKRLEEFIGKSPSYAKNNIYKVKDISISWDIAYDVFINVTLPKWEKKARNAFPGFDDLPSCVRIALISLVFNRGSQINSSDRRIEMKNIRDYYIPMKDYKGIANQIRQMVRLWKGSSIEKGMQNRRFAEAEMVERAVS